jgi:hypothetical protein
MAVAMDHTDLKDERTTQKETGGLPIIRENLMPASFSLLCRKQLGFSNKNDDNQQRSWDGKV